ncbi:OLC1v1019317C1 [Oldenlandia corymbosa var. corymbosa]|uniref:OLC1v1019317C1 n=1 Tax=Oldenlandia corymbosa var. corymbosa TaxID=529605 RepID=A0AAV1EDM3_OLDCO|nr:OLC1v1019317C1 [Oldenlandia corymbosa var. corymbosa]
MVLSGHLSSPNHHPNHLKRNRIFDDGSNDLLSIPADFPEELIMDILSRLPAKSVGKFKCVSKSWLSLISTQGFIKAHLAIASGRDDYQQHCLIFDVYPQNFNGRTFLVDNFQAKSPETETKTKTDVPKVSEIDYLVRNKSVWPIGSSNGLVCMRSNISVLFLCNPTTKEFNRLPKTCMERRDRKLDFGFGYDRLNDDYKIVALIPTSVDSSIEVKVYSLKKNLWRGVEEDRKIRVRVSQFADYFQNTGGKLHWRVLIDGVPYLKIASFDLADETYVEIDCPKNKEGKHPYGLGVLVDDLSLLYNAGTQTDIWVMLKESWTKVFSISYYLGGITDLAPFCSQVVAPLRNGEILCVRDSYLLLYNPKTNASRRFLHIGNFGFGEGMTHGYFLFGNVSLSVESLLSPNVHDI